MQASPQGRAKGIALRLPCSPTRPDDKAGGATLTPTIKVSRPRRRLFPNCAIGTLQERLALQAGPRRSGCPHRGQYSDGGSSLASWPAPPAVVQRLMNRAERVVESMIVEPLEWVREQGIVLQSARGPVPNLAEYVAGEPIRGSWWGHASGHEIFAVLSRVLNSPDVIATRLVNGKVTLIHRRLWPALVRVADRFPKQ